MVFYVNFLVGVGRVDTDGVLVVDIGDAHLLPLCPPDGDDHVLPDGHGQHRVPVKGSGILL